MADAILSTAIKLLVLSLFFRLKLNNFYITSSININSTDWSTLTNSTRPISIGLAAYRSRPRISQAGAILDSCPELGSPRQLLLSLLLVAGDISINPGPQWKFPCGFCSKPVKRNQRGIQCDNCDRWFHTRCCKIGDESYKILGLSSCIWICCDCNAANYSTAPCNSLLDSFNSPGYFSPLANLQQTEISPPHVNNQQTGTTSPLAFL